MALDECPLCYKYLSSMTQHLRISHRIINKEETILLLKLVSGRVDVRVSTCPIPRCKHQVTRMDRHLKTHRELSKRRQTEAMDGLKRTRILSKLAELRASNPAVPLVSDLDIVEEQHQQELLDIDLGAAAEDPPCPEEEEEEVEKETPCPEEEEEEEETPCPEEEEKEETPGQNVLCERRARLVEELQKQVADVSAENASLTTEVNLLTRQNRLLHRRLLKKPRKKTPVHTPERGEMEVEDEPGVSCSTTQRTGTPSQ